MTITLDLPAEIAEAFLAEAQAKGISLNDLVRDLLLARQPALSEMPPEEWVREFRAWTRSHDAEDLPVLTDEAISRDFIYRDRGL